jgi:hypothetical protein
MEGDKKMILFRIIEGIKNWFILGNAERLTTIATGIYFVLSIRAFWFYFHHRKCLKQ